MKKNKVTVIDLLNKIHWKHDSDTIGAIVAQYNDLITSDKFDINVRNNQKIYFNQETEQYEYRNLKNEIRIPNKKFSL